MVQTVFLYFPTKDALFRAAVTEPFRTLQRALSIEQIEGTPLERLQQVARGHVSFVVQHRDYLLLPRPLAFYLGRQMMTGGRPELIARWDALWQYPGFRYGNRVVSVVWGCGLVLEALLRILLALSLTTSMFLLLWPVLSYGIYAVLLVWTVSYARR